MSITNNHHNGLEVCPDCGDWTRNPDQLFCSKCSKSTIPLTRRDRMLLARSKGLSTLSRLRARLVEIRKEEENLKDRLWGKADAEVLKKIADDALLCKRAKSDIDNRSKEVEARFEQLLDQDPEYAKICRAFSGISWVIKSLKKLIEDLKQKSTKTIVAA